MRIDGYVYVSPVRAFAPNEWAIYDPVGNLWHGPQLVRFGKADPEAAFNNNGFRCARTLPTAASLSPVGQARSVPPLQH